GTVSPGSAQVSADLQANQATLNSPPANLPVGDPLRRRYVLFLSLTGDYDINACQKNLMAGDETWTIAVASGPNVTGVCLENFDLNVMGNQCNAPRFIPPTELPIATVAGFPPETAACAETRPAVDAMLVIDKSGSMASPTLGGASRPKIDALHDAVTNFVTQWTTI